MAEMTKQEMMEMILESNRQFAATLAAELRKPDPKVEAKEQAQEARTAQVREQIIKAELAAHEAKLQMQMSCTHKKENGKFSTGGQVLNNGKLLILCSQCSKDWMIDITESNRRMIESGDLSVAEMAPPENWIRPN